MRQQGGRKLWSNRAGREADPGSALEALLALDRTLMEISMRLYNLPRRERLILRGHSRRLHHAVRQEQGAMTATPNCITVGPLNLLDQAREAATDAGRHPKRRRRSKVSARPEV